jgi:hypothetical protein
MRTVGPDAMRYLRLAEGRPVPRPFHLRIGLPWLCGTNFRRWWVVYLAAWPIAALGMFAWRAPIDGWQIALAATALLLALPGILGPSVVIPVGVDLPATALALVGVALIADGHPARIIAGVAVIAIAASIRETTPIWAALWLWSPWPLIGLVVPLVVALVRKPGPDPLGDQFQYIADHPIRSALEHHRGRWRDGWLLVATWGVTLAALIEPDWRLLVVLGVAHLQLLVATDTVRLVHHAAGPAMAAAAAQVIPVQWLLLAVVAHTFWFRKPERV